MKNILRGLYACALATVVAPVLAQEPAVRIAGNASEQVVPSFLQTVTQGLTEDKSNPTRDRRVATIEQEPGFTSNPRKVIEEQPARNPVEEIVVTGTHIRGAAPIGSPLIVIDREDIRASGHGRVQDLLEELPQNFNGSASEDANNDSGAANLTRGQAIDLRGIGASATLILINGRRQPSGGLEGSYVDISSIPTSAIERIEVLTDGASALYGSDAIGGVINFVLRKDYEDVETDLRFGTASNAEELRMSQVVGQNWTGGSVIVGYQYFRRDAVMAADTPYGSTNRDFRHLGGSDFRTPGGNPGTILDPLTFQPAFAIPAGQDGTSLTPSELIAGQANYWDTVTDTAVVPEQIQHSAFFTLSNALTDWLEIFAEGRYSQRDMKLLFSESLAFLTVPTTNPFYIDPFGTGNPLQVAYSFGDDLGTSSQTGGTHTYTFATGGAAQLGRQWELSMVAAYGREENTWDWINVPSFTSVAAALADPNPATALNVFGDGSNTNPATIDSIRRTSLGDSLSTISSLTGIADGPIFRVPAGVVKLAIGFDYRDESLDAKRGTFAPATGITTPSAALSIGKLDRQIAAFFGEMVLPLVGDRNSISTAPVLEVSLAGRYEDYSDFGSTLNPKLGFNLMPSAGVLFRGSWGTSFRAPRFNQMKTAMGPETAISAFGEADPKSPTGRSDVLYLTGGNPNLHEETAEIWTAGVDLAPTLVPDLSFSATYFSLNYENKIQRGGAGGSTLLLEDQWAEIITRDPTQAQVEAVCSSSGFVGACPSAPAAIIDVRVRNLAGVRLRGLDFNLDYRSMLNSGKFSMGLGGTYMFTHDRAVSATASYFDVLDTVGNPLALRLQGRASWEFDPWQINGFVNYTDDYRDASNKHVNSWTTLNASVGYKFVEGDWLDGMNVQMSVVNVFDESPPFVNDFFGFDGANANQMGRSLSLELRKRW